MNECWCYEDAEGKTVICSSCVTDQLVSSMETSSNPTLLKEEIDNLIAEVDGWLARS